MKCLPFVEDYIREEKFLRDATEIEVGEDIWSSRRRLKNKSVEKLHLISLSLWSHVF